MTSKAASVRTDSRPQADPAAGAAAASPRRYLPVSSPLASGKNGSSPIRYVSQRRDQVGLDAALEQLYSFCALMNRCKPRVRAIHSASADLPAAEVRAAEIAHLALVHQVVQRRQRLLDRGRRFGPVQLVEVDPVGAQPAHRRLDGAPDVAAGSAGAPVLAVATAAAAHVAAELGRDHDVVAPARRAARRAAPRTRRRSRRCRTR